MAAATSTLDLTPVLDVLRNYHRIARADRTSGTGGTPPMLDRAAEILRTGGNPNGVSAECIRALMNKVYRVIHDDRALEQIAAA
jgi:hypothetical protein